VCFIVADFMILTLFPFWKCKTQTERKLCLATIMDLVIVGVVLALFFVAEAQRCCEDTSTEGLRELVDAIGEDYLFESQCTCPKWGTRIYGGLGMIEPFTSLIVLRLFRFQFAHFFIRIFSKKRSLNETVNDLKSDLNSQHHNDSNHGGQNGHGHENNMHISGTAMVLWERAIAEFPEVVEKYGQFSGELLQAMLGLQVDMESPGVSASTHLSSLEIKKDNKKDLSKSGKLQSHIKLAGSRYAKLPPTAQGIVIAGSLGKPVKPMHPEGRENAGIELSTVNKGGTALLSAMPPSTGLVEFEVDTEQIHYEHNTTYTFVAPFARLVRSMRRCDRRHLPLLKEWISVDVVITQFEIVVSA